MVFDSDKNNSLQEEVDSLLKNIKDGNLLVNETDMLTGKTPLHLACELGDIKKIKELLDLSADINVKSTKSLVDANNPNFIDTSTSVLQHAYQLKKKEVVEFLIKSGADINAYDNEGRSLLHYAMYTGDLELVKELVSKGGNLNQKDERQWTPLTVAVQFGKNNCLEYVLPLVDDIAHEDLQGRTLLHQALDEHNLEVIQILLQHKKAREAAQLKDIYGRTAIDMAVTEGLDDVVSAISDLPLEQFTQLPNYNKKLVDISQTVIREKFDKYLELEKRNESFLNEKGYCNGISCLAAYYQALNKEEEFYSILQTLAQWDPDVTPLSDVESVKIFSGNYKNLGALFEQWINDLAWFSQGIKLDEASKLRQTDFNKMFELVSNKIFEEKSRIAFCMTKSQIGKMLEHIRQFPNMDIILRGAEHSCYIHVTPEGKFKYYDSNLISRFPAITSTDELTTIIQKIKYTQLSKDSENMAISFSCCKFSEEKTASILTTMDPAVVNLDEEFIFKFLNTTNSFKENGELDGELLMKSLETAIGDESTQSLRALVRYANHDNKYMIHAFTSAMYSSSVGCCLALLDEGCKPDKFVRMKADNLLSYTPNGREDRAKKIQFILDVWNNEVKLTPHDPIYHAFVSAIERNDISSFNILLSQHRLSSEDSQSIMRIAVFLEGKDFVKKILDNYKIQIKKEFIDYAEKFGNRELLSILKNAIEARETVTTSKASLFSESRPVSNNITPEKSLLSEKKSSKHK